MCRETTLNAMVLAAIIILCFLGAFTMTDASTLLNTAMAGLLGYIGKGAVDATLKR